MIQTKIQITPQIKEILLNKARYKIIVAGRQWGKTHCAIAWLLRGTQQPYERRWYIAPSYRMAKTIAWPIIKRLLGNHPYAKINESELTVTFTNSKSEIALKGADNEDSLRGVGLKKVVMDEFAFMKPHVWEEIILPTLTVTQGEAFFIGTPDGFNHFYDIYLSGLTEDLDYRSWQYKTIDSIFVNRDEIEKYRRSMDPRLYRQEFEASFETLGGSRASYNFDRTKHLKTNNDRTYVKYAGIDFNVDHMSAEIACEFGDGHIHYFDEIRLRRSNTAELGKLLKDKHPDLLEIYPDPTGEHRSTNSNKSDHMILRDLGFNVITRTGHPSHNDMINTWNRKLKDAEGNIKLSIDPKCVELIRDCEQVLRKPDGRIDKSQESKGRVHALQAAMYPVEYRFPIGQIGISSMEWE
ncbi:MAG: terminase [Candidatus Pelagibacter sp.]|nr:terminase [Candidatus Pelagibacter sp.]